MRQGGPSRPKKVRQGQEGGRERERESEREREKERKRERDIGSQKFQTNPIVRP